MEPPAVTSCGVGGHPSSGLTGGMSGNQQKRDMAGVGGFIQIDSQISFNTPNRHFEELPENFLETISPQQGHSGGHGHHHSMAGMGSGCEGTVGRTSHSNNSPQLASLTTVSMAGSGSTDGNSGYANLVPMPSSSHYISALKMESMEHIGHHSQLHSSGQLDKNFGNGPAGLLSPLQLEGNRTGDPGGSLGLLSSVSVSHLHRPNGGSRTSDLLSGIRRSTNSVAYIKEEINPVNDLGGYQPNPAATHHHEAYGDANAYSIQGPSAQELERMANAETPPALSSVEITSSILASLSRDSPSPNIQQHSPHQPTHFIVHQMSSRPQPQQHQMVQHHAITSATPSTSAPRRSKAKQVSSSAQSQHNSSGQQRDDMAMVGTTASTQQGYGPLGPGAGVPRSTYSTTDLTDPLNAEIDDEIYIDTKDLCKRVAYELKQHSIPQAIFAERILCRSQGTLSDLLRNPKPWNRLKSGRETFRRMFNWLQQPLHIRLSILDMYKVPMASAGIPPPTPAQNSRHHHRNRRTSDGNEEGANPPQKRPRLVFTDIQKRTLQAIFKETQRPSREMQQTIAEHLRLDMSTVSNFFMNARRRSRNGNGMGDEPAPYQQVRTITPPPDSPPTAQQQHQMIVTTSEHQHVHQHQQLQTSTMTATAAMIPLTTSIAPSPSVRKPTKASGIHHHNLPSSASNLSHIEETVDEVVVRSVAYARSKQQQEQQQLQHFSLRNVAADLLEQSQQQQQQPPIWEEDDLIGADIGCAGNGQELQFMNEVENNGSLASVGDSFLHKHKQEEEEEAGSNSGGCSGGIYAGTDLSTNLDFVSSTESNAVDHSSEEMVAAASLIVQSFSAREMADHTNDSDIGEDGGCDEGNCKAMVGTKTLPLRKLSATKVDNGRTSEQEQNPVESIDAGIGRSEMDEAEAPTEPGTPNLHMEGTNPEEKISKYSPMSRDDEILTERLTANDEEKEKGRKENSQ